MEAARAESGVVWSVSSDGTPLAHVATYRDGAGTVVTAQFFGTEDEAERIRPYRFDHQDAADAFVHDLVASFAYLGCHVTRP